MKQEGWKIPPKVRADYLKCMKKYRAELYKALFETPGLLSFMKREKLIPLEDIAGLLKKEAVHEDRIAELMDYQEQAFSPEEREAYEREKRQTKQILATGVLPVPIAKKFWRYKQVEDGTIRLMHYLGNEAEVKIPSEIGGVPVASLGRFAFDRNKDLVRVDFPDGITSIGDHAFFYCEQLTEVSLPDKLTYLGKSVFDLCHNLREITIPEGVTCIETTAFNGCDKLAAVKLPQSLTKIGRSAFGYCANLTEIVIPDRVICILERAPFIVAQG